MIRKTLFSLATLVCLLFSYTNASIIYIDSAHLGGVQSGSSWGTAFTSFQSGVNTANVGDSVWVAEGTYQPDSFFILKEGVKIFGGFQNTATSFGQRDYESNLTTLTGNSGRVIVNVNNYLLSKNYKELKYVLAELSSL